MFVCYVWITVLKLGYKHDWG